MGSDGKYGHMLSRAHCHVGIDKSTVRGKRKADCPLRRTCCGDSTINEASDAMVAAGVTDSPSPSPRVAIKLWCNRSVSQVRRTASLEGTQMAWVLAGGNSQDRNAKTEGPGRCPMALSEPEIQDAGQVPQESCHERLVIKYWLIIRHLGSASSTAGPVCLTDFPK